MSAITSALGALKYVPASVGIKLLEKANPKFKNYFTSAAAYGYDANHALDYLKERFDSDSSKSFKEQLNEGAKKGHLRPDEGEAKNQLSNAEIPGKILRSAVAYGGAALAGGLTGAAIKGASEILPSVAGKVANKAPLAISNPQRLGITDQRPFQGPKEFEGIQQGVAQQGQTHGPFPKKTNPKSPQEATKLYNQRNKDKKLIDKLRDEFIQNYGPEEAQGTAALQQGSDPDTQALLQALQQLKQARGG